MKRWLLWALPVLALVLAGTLVMRRGASPAPGAAPAASTAATAARPLELLPQDLLTARRQPLQRGVEVTGTLEAVRSAVLRAKVAGELKALDVREGESVRAGQVLGQIDPTEFDLRLRQSQQQSEAAKAQLDIAVRQLSNSQALVAQGFISPTALETAAATEAGARANLQAALAAVALAQKARADATLVAPIGGVVAERMAKPGNLININTPLYRIVDNSRLEAVLNVPEREMATMKPGLPIRMVVDALRGQVFEGVVGRISPVVDAGSGTFRVVGVFAGHEGLKPGMFGRLQIVYDEREAALSVPREAVVEANGEASVFLVEAGKAVRRVVRLGHVDGAYAEVVEGLAVGDQVITAGRIAVRDGVTVEVLGAPATAATSAAAPAVAD